jgi:hypothetical protein
MRSFPPAYRPTSPLPPAPMPGQTVVVPLDRWLEYRITHHLVVVAVHSVVGQPVVIQVRAAVPGDKEN